MSVEDLAKEIEAFDPWKIECFECIVPRDDMRRKVLAMVLSEIERKNPGLTTQKLIDLLK